LGAFVAAGTAGAVETAGEARAYIEIVFFEHDCRMSLRDFEARMLADGMAPRPEDIQTPEIGQEKIFRQRRISGQLTALSEQGILISDPEDPRYATLELDDCP
jgi:hypothetical protein